jgi:hypothetical protein
MPGLVCRYRYIKGKPRQVKQMSNQPTKEIIRAWLQQRQTHREPLPSNEQIRRQLGWSLAESVRAEDQPLTATSATQFS